MPPRFITKRIHAFLDYPVAFGLMAMPILLGLDNGNALAFWLSFTTGAAALVLTVLTDHHLGLFRVLPYRLHLAVDGSVGVVFVGVALMLGFTGLDFWYYIVLGSTVLTVVGLHKPEAGVASA